MTRIIRSQGQLRDASNHLFYEIWMFQTLAKGMASGIAGNGAINNSLLESFAIHVRALIGFFYSDNPRPDDIIAEDFFENDNEWKNIRPVITEILINAKKRADKEIAHLTYNRLDITPEQKPWEFIRIFSNLQAPIKIFLENASTDLLGSSWDETKRRQVIQE
ncbi:MAG: hypothetical protein IPP66_23265 [Anaerolineales bacterium]|nr:hypothetical protein [Anaerolineales bacterium]